ncbi:helix-turn-helix transcriptional regulator [Steroidobacter agaridevorans]|uniref:helix-turn-helix transcriptional regulator n=1 Tax=Steroidobacter agaridevorans TaxID=2695856 RepID=UPI00137AA1E5
MTKRTSTRHPRRSAGSTLHSQHSAIAEPIPTQLLRLPAVLAMTGLKTTKLYALIADDEFPKPVVLARARNGQPRTVAWPAHEVHHWISSKIAERDTQS